MPVSAPLRLAVLVSGAGTTLQHLLDESAAGRLPATIELVIGSRPGLAGVGRGERAGVPTAVVDRRDFPPGEAGLATFSAAVFDRCDAAGTGLTVCAGWLCKLAVPPAWAGRVMNVHPSLLPSFGGRGMFGRHVHAAVLALGCKVSGCTVHLVDDDYDAGPIVVQRPCPVLDDDTPDSLAARVQAEERVALSDAITSFAEGRLMVHGRRVTTSARPSR